MLMRRMYAVLTSQPSPSNKEEKNRYIGQEPVRSSLSQPKTRSTSSGSTGTHITPKSKKAQRSLMRAWKRRSRSLLTFQKGTSLHSTPPNTH